MEIDEKDIFEEVSGEEEKIEMTEEELLKLCKEFDQLIESDEDPNFNVLLADQAHLFGLAEKVTIMLAYKKGGFDAVKNITGEYELD